MILRRALVACLFSFLSIGGCRSTRTSDAPTAPSPETSPSPTSASAEKTGNVATPTRVVGTDPGHAGAGTPLVAQAGHALAAFSEGCFWGSEETFRQVEGVTATAVGYTGGHTKNPTYDSVCTHTTGHAETVLVEFDPTKVSYAQLLQHFWASHDPTQKNKQGPDIGDQYRSAIWTFDDAQLAVAKSSLAEAQKGLDHPIATEIRPIGAFWKAEDYHQQYDEKMGKPSCGTGFGTF